MIKTVYALSILFGSTLCYAGGPEGYKPVPKSYATETDRLLSRIKKLESGLGSLTNDVVNLEQRVAALEEAQKPEKAE